MPLKLERRQAQLRCWRPFCLPLPAFAADLLQVYREALAYDAQYAAARATAEAGREKQPQALAGLLPTIGASGNTFWNDTKLRQPARRSPADLRRTATTATPMAST
jgi:outer membrane protein TolC